MPEPERDRGTLIALEPRIRAAFHPLYHEIARRPDLSAGAKVVYAVLCSYHQMFNDVFPGRERLAADTGLSAHQLVDATSALVKAGLLHVRRRGFGQTNVYTLLRWPESPDIPQGMTGVPDGISGEPPGNDRVIEEENQNEAQAIWQGVLDRLRTDHHLSTGNLTILAGYRVRLDGETLVIRGDRRWQGYVHLAADGRPVKFE